MSGPKGNSEFCFPRISMFTEMKLRETLRFEDLLYPLMGLFSYFSTTDKGHHFISIVYA